MEKLVEKDVELLAICCFYVAKVDLFKKYGTKRVIILTLDKIIKLGRIN